MGFFLTDQSPTLPLASPKTHTPLLRVEERGLRFYSANLSRWLSRDPIGEAGGNNLYGYTHNCAVSEIDALGLAGVNQIRIGFVGAGQAPSGLESWPQTLALYVPSGRIYNWFYRATAERDILKDMDTDRDGKVTCCDDEPDIRIAGFSYGGWSALTVAKWLEDCPEVKCDKPAYRRVRLGTLDPVRYGRLGIARLPSNVSSAVNIYQRNGCVDLPSGRGCFSWGGFYRGTDITGARNIDVSGYGVRVYGYMSVIVPGGSRFPRRCSPIISPWATKDSVRWGTAQVYPLARLLRSPLSTLAGRQAPNADEDNIHRHPCASVGCFFRLPTGCAVA
jgi:RHS repeat-associated protein